MKNLPEGTLVKYRGHPAKIAGKGAVNSENSYIIKFESPNLEPNTMTVTWTELTFDI